MARNTPPRWRDIADDLLRRIERGDLSSPDGATGRVRLPAEKVLEAHYTASRNTVRDALNWLQRQGHVVSEQGKGTFVVHRPITVDITLSAVGPGEAPSSGTGNWYNRDAIAPGREVSVSPLKVEIQEGPEQIAWYMRANAGDVFVSRHQELYLDERPWALQTSFYPLDFVTQGASRLLEPRDINQGAVAYLNKTLGYIEVGFHDEIKVRLPDENEKRFFSLGESAADVVFETIRIAYSAEGNAFRLTVTVWPADRTRLHYNSGTVPDSVLASPRHPLDESTGRERSPTTEPGTG